jgi:hypothetical protein
VAPPCPGGAPAEIAGFFPTGATPAALARAAGDTRVVCATDDPYCPEGAASCWAAPLGLAADVVPRGGHLNPEAGSARGPRWRRGRWASAPRSASCGRGQPLPEGDPDLGVRDARLQREQGAVPGRVAEPAQPVVQPAIELQLLAVAGGEAGRDHLRVGAEEELEQPGVPQLRQPRVALGQPGGERLPATVGDLVDAPPAPAGFAVLRDVAAAGQALGLGVEL